MTYLELMKYICSSNRYFNVIQGHWNNNIRGFRGYYHESKGPTKYFVTGMSLIY